MAYKYSTKDMGENTAKAVLLSQSISEKQAVETAKAVRGQKTAKAIAFLEKVVEKKQAVSYTQFHGDIGHKRSVSGAGRYPVKTAQAFIKGIKLVVSNADNKNLDTNNLVLKSIVIQKGPKTPRYGRQRGRTGKNTHIEFVVEELKK